MQADICAIAANFLKECEPLLQRIDELPLETANELYDMLSTLARALCAGRRSVHTHLRVQVCVYLDALLERLADISEVTHVPAASVYTPAVHKYRRWQNVELMKDKGLAGYMLAKHIRAKESVMFFGDKTENYTYVQNLPGISIVHTDEQSGEKEAYYTHLQQNYHKMDFVILHGMYNETMLYLNEYRKLRADGKVFCGLDMSSYWMGNINWDNPAVERFAAQCNLVATSCRGLRDELNANPLVPFACRFMPNGFYNAHKLPIIADEKTKENTILTVGRIGSKQKNNEDLVVAFAAVAERIPEWTLKLVGYVEEHFYGFIDDICKIKPEIKGRIVLTGAITNKKELYSEYSRAKVFALTSQTEGGTPNVYAEALFHGCMFVTSSIDAASDITNSGELGEVYTHLNTEALAAALVKICCSASEAACKAHIKKAQKYAEKNYNWERNAKKLALALARA